MPDLVYKVLAAAEWCADLSVYHGSADDARDGFIHLSTAAQLPGTLERHFRGREDLVLLAVDAAALGEALRWEPSRGGDLFPHLYGALPRSAIRGESAIASWRELAKSLPPMSVPG
jgi:uncharacterized protein (DUF952 family)